MELERLQRHLQEIEEKKGIEETRIEELENERRKKEGELDGEQARIKKSQLRLLEIKTNKEYQALLKEIDWAKEANDRREEDVILIMDQIDESKTALALLEKQLDEERRETERSVATTRERMAQLGKDMVRAQQAKEELLRSLDPDLLLQYTRLKQRRDGVAMVPVKNEACQGCFVHIPPQMYNEVRKNNTLILCPNCNRILYWANDDVGTANADPAGMIGEASGGS
jgi:hypothetical protein